MPRATIADVERLVKAAEPYSRILILTHNNPDPDALASAAGLRLLLNTVARKPTAIGYAGFLTRAENREMVRRLHLPIHDVEHVDMRRFRAIILVDTQPGAGNNPAGTRQKIIGVVDHHPPRRASRALPFSLVDVEPGATSTLVYELLKAASVRPPSNIATALFFGIKTDTQDLGREAAGRDLAAYEELFALANHRTLAQIMHPRLPATYFRTVDQALQSALLYGDCIYAPVGEITTPEYASEIADYFVALEGMRWAVATGRYKGNLYFSVRTFTARKDAGRILRRAMGGSGFAGGHQKMAGGVLLLAVLDPAKRQAVEQKVLAALFAAIGATTANAVPLLSTREPAKDGGSPGDGPRGEGTGGDRATGDAPAKRDGATNDTARKSAADPSSASAAGDAC